MFLQNTVCAVVTSWKKAYYDCTMYMQGFGAAPKAGGRTKWKDLPNIT